MDFFRSILSEDPDPPPLDHEEEEEEEEEVDDQDQEETSESPNPSPNSRSTWSFGGLIKTIASKSESVIETYRRDLEEFGTELKKETSVFKEVAARAVLDLPGSLEVGASVAQESLESVGQAIDDFGGSVWRGTAEIISHGKDALFTVDSDLNSQNSIDPQNFSGPSSKRYSRFEVQVLALQNDEKTFVEEVEDGEDFEKWRLAFRLEEEIEGILYENGTLEGLYERFVPDVVDRETFWSRYFYRVYKLKQAEDARAKLVKRVISGEEEEEELTWEVDDEDENEEEVKGEVPEVEEEKNGEGEMVEEEKKPVKEVVVEEEEIVETSEKPREKEVKKEIIDTSTSIERPQAENVDVVEKVKSSDDDDLTSIAEDKMPLEPKSEESVESGKDSAFSMVSTQPSVQEEEDLEWDEIEDLGEHEDKIAGGSSVSPKPVDLRKRSSVAEDDEDLSWDIEEDDDDEPAKP